MPRKRVLLVSLFFFILTGSLIYYVFPRVFFAPPPLRRDEIPEGVYVVPWTKPHPSINELELQIPGNPPPWDIDVVMADALKLNMTFRIVVPGDVRVVTSTVYLAHDLNYLYVGGKFRGMHTNPASTSNRTVPNYLSIFLDVANDGELDYPESGSSLSAYVNPNGPELWAYHDMIWLAYSRSYGHAAWIIADNLDRPPLVCALGNMVIEFDNSTCTLTILFSRLLWRPENAEVNALQMRPGERWVMGFLLELGFATNTIEPRDLVDGWPQNTYPYLTNDASWWPKLCIDLSNPPPSFS